MTTPLDQMIAEFEWADDYLKERELRAKRLKMPADPEAWLLDLEKRLTKKLPQLPEPVRGEYSELMADQIKAARNWLALGEEVELRTMVALLFDNYNLVLHNLDRKDAVPARKGRSAGGQSTAEHKQAEAEANIAQVVELWERLEAQGRPERERAAIIATRMGRPIQSVRRWIRKANIR